MSQDQPLVASYTDAWIEIFRYSNNADIERIVASYTDAWIEIGSSYYIA